MALSASLGSTLRRLPCSEQGDHEAPPAPLRRRGHRRAPGDPAAAGLQAPGGPARRRDHDGRSRRATTRLDPLGTFLETHADTPGYDARSWTEGEEATSNIEQVNDLTLVEVAATTAVILQIRIHSTGSGAKMAAFAMVWGYKEHLDNLEVDLAADGQASP